MGRLSITKDPTRQAFQHVGSDCWECKDYKTFYMTIRPSNTEMDKSRGRDPNHYVLSVSTGDNIDGLNGLPLAFAAGYDYADKIYKQRYPGLNF